jgi:hypothetical protein
MRTREVHRGRSARGADRERECSQSTDGSGQRSEPLIPLLFIAAMLATPGCSCGDGVNPRDHDAAGGTDTNEFYPDGAVIPVDIVTLVPGTPADAATRFMDPDAPTSDGAPDLLYPLDGVLFPRNVWSPDVQWDDPGVEGDLYRVRFTGAPVTLTVYLAHTGAGFTWDHLVAYASWRRLTNGAAGRDMQLSVDRWIAASHTVVHGTPITVSISSAGIAGAVYYWTLGSFDGTEGRILRVRQGTEVAPEPENFMPTPPAGSDGMRCAACHGLSRDGNHLAASLRDGEFGAVFDLTTDLTTADPTPLFRFDRPWFFAAFSPEGSRVVMTDPAQHTFLLDGATGTEITTLRDATHPAWSPDGMQLTLVANANDAWNPNHGDLVTLPVTGGDTFGAEALLHAGDALSSSPEGGTLDCYPSYSPDSRFVSFQHGTGTVVSASEARGALYLVPSGGGSAVRLDHASDGQAFYPNFTPFITEATEFTRVYWVLHYSPRDYGNAHVGTRGTGRRQIWVSAVSSDVGADDPSAVPYWLPGQHVSDQNASAFWAPLPCRATGAGCDTDDQCCGGTCGNAPAPRECLPPPMCRHEGESCAVTGNCCEPSLECIGGACVATGPI